ncbi:MAG: DNA adenine methylase [Sedimentisphaerales bacterium]|nr:DNA adenine methylase [Sedimentisphaerales bacterium]
MKQLQLFDDIEIQKPVNVASVPMRSPFRYAGGKTWFIPYIRKWLRKYKGRIDFIEPFVGGGIVSLTVAFENLAQTILMVEKDEDVASVWKTILGKEYNWLIDQIINFEVTHKAANEVFIQSPKSTRQRAFQTILRNRLQHGGILAHGAGLLKNGENGKGLKSRWYPETLKKRICNIQEIKHKIQFLTGNGIETICKHSRDPHTVFFIDPPYTVAGRRLYKYHKIDHEELFDLISTVEGDFILTYDDAEEIEQLAIQHNFMVKRVIMKTTHHTTKYELVIGNNLNWL